VKQFINFKRLPILHTQPVCLLTYLWRVSLNKWDLRCSNHYIQIFTIFNRKLNSLRWKTVSVSWRNMTEQKLNSQLNKLNQLYVNLWKLFIVQRVSNVITFIIRSRRLYVVLVVLVREVVLLVTGVVVLVKVAVVLVALEIVLKYLTFLHNFTFSPVMLAAPLLTAFNVKFIVSFSTAKWC